MLFFSAFQPNWCGNGLFDVFFKNINLPPVTFFHSFHVCTELMHTLQCQAAKYVLCIIIPLRGPLQFLTASYTQTFIHGMWLAHQP